MRYRATLLLAGALTAALLTGCGAAGTSASLPSPAPAGSSATSSAASSVPAEARPLLAQYGLGGLDAPAIVDRLDRLGGPDRPADLRASVRPDQLLLTGGGGQFALPLPKDRFYLSVAPYVTRTHECFYHSLTTCQGELTGAKVQVRIVDSAGKVLVDGARTTFANGFVGFWLPRGITGTLQVSYDGKVGQLPITTGADAPTCLTTLRLT